MKGNIVDMVIVLVMVFVFIICAVLGLHILNNFQSESSEILTAPEAQTALNQGVATFQYLDSGIVFAFFGLSIAVMLGAFMVSSHPAFLVISILLFAFVIFLSAQFTNVYMEFATHSTISGTAEQFPLSVMLFSNLPLIVLLIGALILIIVYAKTRDPGGGGPI